MQLVMSTKELISNQLTCNQKQVELKAKSDRVFNKRKKRKWAPISMKIINLAAGLFRNKGWNNMHAPLETFSFSL